MSRRTLTVVSVNQNCAYISGYGSRELITELRGRPPVWSCLGRAWVVSPKTARDVAAAAESRGYDIVMFAGDPLPAARGLLW